MATSARPALLIVHGALGSAEQMAPVADAARAHEVFAAVHTLELPGHGRTPALSDAESDAESDAAFSMPAFADVIAARVRELAPQRVLVFGYSMGGYAALLAEQMQPGLVAGIVTLGTMLAWTPEVAEAGARRLNPEGMRAKVPAFADALAARHAEAGGWELTLARTAALLRALGEAPPLTTTSVAQIAAPVRLLVGSRDDSVTLEESQRLAEAMPRAEAVLLDGVPHPIEKVPLDLLIAQLSPFASRLPE
jgi:pimeloyl-ACP methyl ester carboxylesterase